MQRAHVRRSGARTLAAHDDAAVRALQAQVGIERSGQLDVRAERDVVIAEVDVAGRAGRLAEEPGDVERGHGRVAAWACSSGSTTIAPAMGCDAVVGRRTVALVEHVDAALDAGQRLDALALEPDQHAGGVLVGAATDLARLALGLLEDLAGALLRRADQLAFLEHLRCLLLRARRRSRRPPRARAR